MSTITGLTPLDPARSTAKLRLLPRQGSDRSRFDGAASHQGPAARHFSARHSDWRRWLSFHFGVGLWATEGVCEVWGNGDNKLPFVLVSDVASAFVRGIQLDGIEGHSYNLVDFPN